MKVLIQRVSHASVVVDGEKTGAIGEGILALVGIEKHDNKDVLQRMCNKLLSYRIFSDQEGKMNLSLKDTGGGLLAISQFTLAANTNKGLRPSFSSASPPSEAEPLFNQFIEQLQAQHSQVATGKFAADMKVSLLNDGPVTFLLEL
ncbi:D-tyrosyl-tRNA(Tyr) deacylase [Alteromonadaceae bacterium Bs31]|nr:D-tyrosyl-tRNA(Tyr) deacylase [Alteromonadaceae bacterium Bs31]